MTGKNVLYAAVGAPVVAARRVAEAVAELRSTLNKEADTLGKTANKRVALWADEGEKLVNRITDAKMVDELTSKVDFDQVSTQVSKLRDQLEDMLATWRCLLPPREAADRQGGSLDLRREGRGQEASCQEATAQKAAEPRRLSAKKAPAEVQRRPVRSPAKKQRPRRSPAKVMTVGQEGSSARKAPARKAASKNDGSKKASSTARKSVAVAS